MTDPLVHELTAVLRRRDGLPAGVRRGALAAPDLADVPSLPAHRIPLDRRAPSLTRQDGEAPVLGFVGAGLRITLAPHQTGRTLFITGRLEPVLATTVLCLHPHGGLQVSSDTEGRFTIPGVPTGPLRVLVSTGPDTAADTNWLVL